MKSYLNKTWNTESREFLSCYDELPLWSAKPGFLLLENLDFTKKEKLLDLGSGTGFPLLELAERFGEATRVIGIDPWTEATDRINEKIQIYKVKNVEVLNQSASSLPFEKNSIDMITSNLGINNFDEKEKVMKESFRVLKEDGSICLTSNFDGHFSEFYAVFEEVLRQLDLDSELALLKKHQQKRSTPEILKGRLEKVGFKIDKEVYDTYSMRFSSGSAFLNHHFIGVAFYSPWKEIVKEKDREVFKIIESRLNEISIETNGLDISVPIGFIKAIKPKSDKTRMPTA